MNRYISTIRRWWDGMDPKQPTIFHSARVKLTFFYLGVLLVFSLALTLGTRALAERQYANASMGERGIVRRMLFNFYSVPPKPPNDFNQYQNTQDDAVKRHLNEDVIIINLAALALGGWLSYWYAGRTLKPIEAAHAAQTRFAADASHELRTPLASLKVENEVFLRQKSFDKKEARELIESNLEEVQRLESLAGSLLALTQYGSATTLQLGPVNVSAIVEAAIARTAPIAATKDVHIDSELAAATVIGDFDSLVQLSVIILDNAIKYGPKHGHVYISGAKRSNRYHLAIRDDGPGIVAVDLPHIFERLYRGDKSRTAKVGGYGLGLSLAKEIATMNRASVEASNHTSGAVFTISLIVP
jgi:two-component system sensor histidine kinase CiaH